MNRFPYISEELGYDLDIICVGKALETIKRERVERDVARLIPMAKAHIAYYPPIVGNIIVMPNDKRRRVTRVFPNEGRLQVTSYIDRGNSDNFLMHKNGLCSYSGILSSVLYEFKNLTELDNDLARFWYFQENWPRASGSLSFQCRTRVWKYAP